MATGRQTKGRPARASAAKRHLLALRLRRLRQHAVVVRGTMFYANSARSRHRRCHPLPARGREGERDSVGRPALPRVGGWSVSRRPTKPAGASRARAAAAALRAIAAPEGRPAPWRSGRRDHRRSPAPTERNGNAPQVLAKPVPVPRLRADKTGSPWNGSAQWRRGPAGVPASPRMPPLSSRRWCRRPFAAGSPCPRRSRSRRAATSA